MVSIVHSQGCENHLELYRQWVSREWGSDHSFESPEKALFLPSPLLAMIGEKLVGGISFTWHPAPASSVVALWINTLYVKPSYRGRGIASALITEAEKTARMTVHGKELFVYTDVPVLYARNEWLLVSQEKEMCILHKQL